MEDSLDFQDFPKKAQALARSFLRRHEKSLPQEELVPAVRRGIALALKRYEPEHPEFVHYASWALRSELTKAIISHYETVRSGAPQD